MSPISMAHGIRVLEFYRLEDSIGAIEPDASGQKPGVFVRLPAGSVLEFRGPTDEPNMVEVICDQRRFLLFRVDLQERASRYSA